LEGVECKISKIITVYNFIYKIWRRWDRFTSKEPTKRTLWSLVRYQHAGNKVLILSPTARRHPTKSSAIYKWSPLLTKRTHISVNPNQKQIPCVSLKSILSPRILLVNPVLTLWIFINKRLKNGAFWRSWFVCRKCSKKSRSFVVYREVSQVRRNYQ
jgi:hypothetical protein